MAARQLMPILMGILLCGGCGNSEVSPPQESSPQKVPADPGAKELLTKLRSAYSNAKSYADNASVVFYAVVRSTGGEQESPFVRSSVAFERPNKYHITHKKYISSPQEESYEIVSNGVVVRSGSDEVPDQIHEAVAPEVMTEQNFIPEPEMRRVVLEESIENTLPQMALLLVDNKEQAIFPGEEQARTLSDAEIDGEAYHRVELPTPDGRRVLWIDQETFTLRRMELPIDNQRQTINSRNQYSKFAVWIDFEDVILDSEIDPVTFDLVVPDGGHRVRRFIAPPPAGPPEYLGKPVGEFQFTDLKGKKLTRGTFASKVVVLEFWSTNCVPCKTQTPVMNEVYEYFKDSEAVEFLAVSTDSRVMPNDAVKKTLASWGGNMPVVRDLAASGYNDLNVRQTPTLLMLDRESNLQVFQIGVHSKPEPVIDAIQRLVDGENLAQTARDTHQDYVEQYQRALETATIEGSLAEEEPAHPDVPPRRLPEQFRLKQLWESQRADLQRPGDILVVDDQNSDAPCLFVCAGGQAIVEFDLQGRRLARHELPESGNETGGFVRSWSDKGGERWTLVSGVDWQKVTLFDDQWNTVLAFPDEKHSGIGDVLFEDLTGSGTPLIHVGYRGGRGVHGVALDGRRLWVNRRLDHVLQVGVGPEMASGDRTTWCTSTRGTLMQIGMDGKSLEERYIEGQSVVYFASHPEGDNHCGVSVDMAGQYHAFGFDQLDKPAWEYALPPGEYVESVPRVLSVALPDGTAGWLVVAANGSLHWLNLEGELLDRFDYGQPLTGLAKHTSDDRSILFVATTEGLTAWEVGEPPPRPVEEPSSEEPETDESIETESSESEDLSQTNSAESSEE